MAGEKAVPANGALSAVSALAQLAPVVAGNKTTTTSSSRSSPVATDALTRIIQDSMYDANNPDVVNNMVQEILRKSAIEFAPTQGMEKQSGLYNSSTLTLLRDRAKADATGAASKAALDFQTNQRGIAANAAGNLAAATKETTSVSKTPPAIPTWATLGIGGAMAAKSLFANSKDITKFLEDPFSNTKKMLLGDEVGGGADGGGNSSVNVMDSVGAAGGFSLGGNTSNFSGSDSGGGGGDMFSTAGVEGLPTGDSGPFPSFLTLGTSSTTSSDSDPEGIGASDINAPEQVSYEENHYSTVGEIAAEQETPGFWDKPSVSFGELADITGKAGVVAGVAGQAGVATEVAQGLAGPLGIAGLGFSIGNNFTNPNYSPAQAIARTAVQIASKAAPFPANIVINKLGLKAVDWILGKEPGEIAQEFMSNPMQETALSIGNMQQATQQVEATPQLGLGTYMSALDQIDTDLGLGTPGAFDAIDPTHENIDWNDVNFETPGDYNAGPEAPDTDPFGATANSDPYGDEGSSSEGSEGSIICTELMRQGRLSKRLWIIGSKEFAGYWEHGKVGYYLWSIPAVAHLKKHPGSVISKALETIFNKRAIYVAARNGYRGYRKTLSGAVLTKGLYGACWLLAVLATPFVSEKIIATAKAGA